MTGFDEWDRLAERQARDDAVRHERQRQALAALLVARRQDAAAAIVAISAWRISCVDGFGVGRYRGALDVPPAEFDLVTDDVHAALDAAAAVLVGEGYDGLDVGIRLPEPAPGWDLALLTWLRDEHRDGGTGAGRVAPLPLPPGTDAG